MNTITTGLKTKGRSRRQIIPVLISTISKDTTQHWKHWEGGQHCYGYYRETGASRHDCLSAVGPRLHATTPGYPFKALPLQPWKTREGFPFTIVWRHKMHILSERSTPRTSSSRPYGRHSSRKRTRHGREVEAADFGGRCFKPRGSRALNAQIRRKRVLDH